MVYLDSVESAQVVRTGSRVGWSLPAHATSSGKTILASLSETELKNLYPNEKLTVPTSAAPQTRTALIEQLSGIRSRGYAVNIAESEVDVSAVGAAVYDRDGRVRGALAITAPRSRVDSSWVTKCSAAVVRGAQTVGKRFG